MTLAFSHLVLMPLRGDDFAGLCASRTAIERVYYQHRLGQKPPFEQISPPSLIERMVRDDLRKEAVLKKTYNVEIDPAMLDAEVQRIHTTTRAPEMLAEIKTALGHDPAKFANAFAKPFLVERLLRQKFENDDTLHAAQRRLCEQERAKLLAAKTNGITATNLLALLKAGHSNQVSETTWQLTIRPAETKTPSAGEIEIRKRFGPEAQVLSSPRSEKDPKFYFEDLPAGLQRLLRVQLCQPGDVSAVVEAPAVFLLYLCEARTNGTLTVGCLTIPKRSYEQWLEEQGKELSSVRTSLQPP